MAKRNSPRNRLCELALAGALLLATIVCLLSLTRRVEPPQPVSGSAFRLGTFTSPWIENVTYRKTSEFDPGTIRVYLRNVGKRELRIKQVLLDGLPLTVWGVDLSADEAAPDVPPETGRQGDRGGHESEGGTVSEKRCVWARLAPPRIPPGGVGEFSAKLVNPLPRPMKVTFVPKKGERFEALVRPVCPPLAITAVTFSEDLDRIYIYAESGVQPFGQPKPCPCGQPKSAEGSDSQVLSDGKEGAPVRPLRITGVRLDGKPVTSGLWLSSGIIEERQKTVAAISLKRPLTQGSFITVQLVCDGGRYAEERVRVFSGFPLNIEWTGRPPEGYGLDGEPYTVVPEYIKSADPGKEAPLKQAPSLRANYIFDCAMHKFAGDQTRCAKETFRRYDICARYDPYHPSLIYMCRIRPETGYALFGETTDILRINPNITTGFSRGRQGESPEETVERISRYAYHAARPRPFEVLADTAGFGDDKALASPEEFRRRVYTMLGCGAKGLLYRHEKWDAPEAAALGEEIRRVNAEVSRIRSYLSVADTVGWLEVGEPGSVDGYCLLAGDGAVVLILVGHDRGGVPGESGAQAREMKVVIRIPEWAVARSVARIAPTDAEAVGFQDDVAGHVRLRVARPTTADAYLVEIRAAGGVPGSRDEGGK